MKRIILTGVFMVILSLTALFACEIDYSIIDQSGTSISATPSQTITLKQGETYTFQMTFYEDHRNCRVPPEDTLFLLDGARWRPQRETQGLVLGGAVEWMENSSRLNTGLTTFTALQPGTYSLEVIRVCDRGGYTAELIFEVSS
jgi:hypothetical protein